MAEDRRDLEHVDPGFEAERCERVTETVQRDGSEAAAPDRTGEGFRRSAGGQWCAELTTQLDRCRKNVRK